MEIESTGLAGSCVLTLRLIEDSRGFFTVFCDQEFLLNGINNKWVQINNSMSINKGTFEVLLSMILFRKINWFAVLEVNCGM